MALQHDDSAPRALAARPRGWLRAAIVGAMAMLFVGAAVGFIAFLSQLRSVEIRPPRNADGIVVPCHRVLAAGNKPGGFSANGGVVTKLKMLEIEGAVVNHTPNLFD